MRLLDLFCGAGGAAMGYYRAGFDEIVGIDNKPQPNYPFEFIQADALNPPIDLNDYDLIHASPPCQAYGPTANLHTNEYPDLVATTRSLLRQSGKPYVIENIPGSPLLNYVLLCGTMFGLKVQRHRLFECEPPIYFSPFACNHYFRTGGDLATYQTMDTLEAGRGLTVVGKSYELQAGRKAMGIDWMAKKELSEAIPPAYTEWLGKQLLQ